MKITDGIKFGFGFTIGLALVKVLSEDVLRVLGKEPKETEE